MAERVATYGIYGLVYLLEGALVLFFLWRGGWRRLPGPFLYVTGLLALDGFGRSYFLYRFGVASREYAHFFWLTDIALALGAFALVSVLFRRATLHRPEMWHHLRLLLALVFVLTLAISTFSLLRNYGNLLTIFIVEFQQNLYFTCLVLNTLLYILLQQTDSVDDELNLLVCGLGIQFAGPTAGLALVYLTQGQDYARMLTPYIASACTLGMLLTWFYAVTRMPKTAPAPAGEQRAPALAEAPVREA